MDHMASCVKLFCIFALCVVCFEARASEDTSPSDKDDVMGRALTDLVNAESQELAKANPTLSMHMTDVIERVITGHSEEKAQLAKEREELSRAEDEAQSYRELQSLDSRKAAATEDMWRSKLQSQTQSLQACDARNVKYNRTLGKLKTHLKLEEKRRMDASAQAVQLMARLNRTAAEKEQYEREMRMQMASEAKKVARLTRTAADLNVTDAKLQELLNHTRTNLHKSVRIDQKLKHELNGSKEETTACLRHVESLEASLEHERLARQLAQQNASLLAEELARQHASLTSELAKQRDALNHSRGALSEAQRQTLLVRQREAREAALRSEQASELKNQMAMLKQTLEQKLQAKDLELLALRHASEAQAKELRAAAAAQKQSDLGVADEQARQLQLRDSEIAKRETELQTAKAELQAARAELLDARTELNATRSAAKTQAQEDHETIKFMVSMHDSLERTVSNLTQNVTLETAKSRGEANLLQIKAAELNATMGSLNQTQHQLDVALNVARESRDLQTKLRKQIQHLKAKAKNQTAAFHRNSSRSQEEIFELEQRLTATTEALNEDEIRLSEKEEQFKNETAAATESQKQLEHQLQDEGSAVEEQRHQIAALKEHLQQAQHEVHVEELNRKQSALRIAKSHNETKALKHRLSLKIKSLEQSLAQSSHENRALHKSLDTEDKALHATEGMLNALNSTQMKLAREFGVPEAQLPKAAAQELLRLRALRLQLNETDNELADDREALEMKNKELESTRARFKGELKDVEMVDQLKEKVIEANRTLRQMRSEMAVREQEVLRVQKSLKVEKAKSAQLKSVQEQAEATDAELQTAQDELERRGEELNKTQKQLDDARQASTAASSASSQLKLRLQATTRQLNFTRTELSAEDGELNVTHKELQKVMASVHELDAMKAELQSAEDAIKSYEGALDARSAELSARQDQLKATRNLRAASKSEITARLNEVESMRRKLRLDADSLAQVRFRYASVVQKTASHAAFLDVSDDRQRHSHEQKLAEEIANLKRSLAAKDQSLEAREMEFEAAKVVLAKKSKLLAARKKQLVAKEHQLVNDDLKVAALSKSVQAKDQQLDIAKIKVEALMVKVHDLNMSLAAVEEDLSHWKGFADEYDKERLRLAEIVVAMRQDKVGAVANSEAELNQELETQAGQMNLLAADDEKQRDALLNVTSSNADLEQKLAASKIQARAELDGLRNNFAADNAALIAKVQNASAAASKVAAQLKAEENNVTKLAALNRKDELMLKKADEQSQKFEKKNSELKSKNSELKKKNSELEKNNSEFRDSSSLQLKGTSLQLKKTETELVLAKKTIAKEHSLAAERLKLTKQLAHELLAVQDELDQEKAHHDHKAKVRKHHKTQKTALLGEDVDQTDNHYDDDSESIKLKIPQEILDDKLVNDKPVNDKPSKDKASGDNNEQLAAKWNSISQNGMDEMDATD